MNVVVTGGGTIAPIDDVRLMTNISSGRFAASISRGVPGPGSLGLARPRPHRRSSRCGDSPGTRSGCGRPLRRAAIGWCASARRWLSARDRLHLVPLEEGTVADYAATLKAVLDAQPIDVAVLAMAVSDFEPEPYAGKISSDAESLVVRCRPTPKVIRSVRDWAPSVYLVGFKLLSRVQPGGVDPPRRGRLPRQPRRPDRRQRSPDPAPGRGTRSTWSGPARSPRPSNRAPTWPTGWSTAS